MTDYIVRKGRGTARARRVMIAPEGLHTGGFRNQTWYSGTRNVDIEEVDDQPPILNIVDDLISGTQSFVWAQLWNNHDLSGSSSGSGGPSIARWRHFLRLFSVRKEIVKFFKEPNRFELWVNNKKLSIYSVGVESIVWRAQWGLRATEEFYITLQGKNEPAPIGMLPTAFSIEVRSEGIVFPLNKISFLIIDSKTKQRILASIMTFIPGTRRVEVDQYSGIEFLSYPGSKVVIEYSRGMQAMKTWNMVSYKGKAVAEFDGSVMTAIKVTEKYINESMVALNV